jgi:hypothetical protein
MYKTFETGCDKSLPKVFFKKGTKEIEITVNLYHFKPEFIFEMILKEVKFYIEQGGKELTIRIDLELISARYMRYIYTFLKNNKRLYCYDLILKFIWLLDSDDELNGTFANFLKEQMPIDFNIHQKLN